ncbi:MAG: hypothetical protein ACKOE6_01215 [Flammeovirgaceae bacterium]
MSIFTYHLVKTSYLSAIKAMVFPPKPYNVPGLVHAECMLAMTLGAPVFSSSRILARQVVLFAQWENETAIDHFLKRHWLGRILKGGWHTRLIFTRQWGKFQNFRIPDENLVAQSENGCVVAVTIARMKFIEIPRFIRWGRPVEKLVRDHPGTTLSLASIKFPNTVSTFSIWRNQKEMTDMVHGRSSVQKPKRHAKAMQERDRRDFHFEFTTLRFKPISEEGKWGGRTNFIDKK